MNELATALTARFGAGRAVQEGYLPIAEWCLDRVAEARRRAAAQESARQALVIGINGPQGCGKSTLAEALVQALGRVGVRALALSIDDLYLPHSDQIALAQAFAGNRYLEFRGYPGTHDVELGVAVLDALRRGEPLDLPAYDKSAWRGRGDRLPTERWRHIDEPIDLVLFEGWMLGFAPLAALDPQCTTELAAVNSLLGRYGAWNQRLDAMILLHTRHLKQVVQWRVDAERSRRVRGEGALSDGAARDYIKRFLPAYRAWLPSLHAQPPGRSTLRVELGPDRLPLRPVVAVDLAKLERRKAAAADVPALTSLVERTLRRYIEKSLGSWDGDATRSAIEASVNEGNWQLLSLNGAVLGVLSVVHAEDEVRIAQLYLQPEYHGCGWGTALVQEVLRDAADRGLPVRLRVLRSNPAQRLYARLGFEVEQSSPERLWMVALPAKPSTGDPDLGRQQTRRQHG